MQGLSKNEPTVYSDLVARRAVTVMSLCIVLFAAVYGLAVWTPAGQQFEDAVLDGAAAIAGTPQEAIATKALARISGVSVAVALVAVVAIGLIRRRARLAVAGTSILVGAIVTTEIMQLLLGRPILLEYGLRREDQSFPSGHTTVAMATVCGLALVVPYRARGAVVFLSSSWAAFVAVATVTANWHRPSDTIGSALIVLCFAATAVAVLSKGGRVQPGAPRTGRGRLAQRVHLYGTALVASAAWVAAIALAVVHERVAGPARDLALAAGRAAALAGSVTVTLAVLALFRGTDLGPGGCQGVETEEGGSRRGLGTDANAGGRESRRC